MPVHATLSGSRLTFSLDRAWLQSPDRRFPVTIDPSLQTTITAADDTLVWNGLPKDYSGLPFMMTGPALLFAYFDSAAYLGSTPRAHRGKAAASSARSWSCISADTTGARAPRGIGVSSHRALGWQHDHLQQQCVRHQPGRMASTQLRRRRRHLRRHRRHPTEDAQRREPESVGGLRMDDPRGPYSRRDWRPYAPREFSAQQPGEEPNLTVTWATNGGQYDPNVSRATKRRRRRIWARCKYACRTPDRAHGAPATPS